MQLKLIRKNTQGDNGPMVVMVEYGEIGKPKSKFIQSINIGQILDIPDELAYQVMGQYPRCFQQLLSTKEKSAAEGK
jgi:hypothetical protein